MSSRRSLFFESLGCLCGIVAAAVVGSMLKVWYASGRTLGPVGWTVLLVSAGTFLALWFRDRRWFNVAADRRSKKRDPKSEMLP